MKKDLMKIVFSGRVLVLISVLLMSLFAIAPNFDADGLEVKRVDADSSASVNGIEADMVLYSLNGVRINDLNDFQNSLSSFKNGEIIEVVTDSGRSSIVYDNGIGFSIGEIPTSNLKKGIDLVGGVRVVLKPDTDDEAQILDMIDLIEQRLNVFGVADLSIRNSKDLEGTNYIITEIAGASKEEVLDLVAKQGKFEAKIIDEVVFTGGTDIKSVCRSGECSGIPLQQGCGPGNEGWNCQYFFRVDISHESAKRHADLTSALDVVDGYLSEKLDLYLDDELVNSLFISEGLQGDISTSFTIQGPGSGLTEETAIRDALDSMKKMQTLLITGSLPFSVEVERVDVISPTLGDNFFTSSLMAIILAIFAVGGVIFVRYRKASISIPIIITGLSEVFIILGFAALIRHNIDLASIAGILAAVGTGVDDQIVITDEVLHGRRNEEKWLKRMKNAFLIIFAAYITMLAAMIPLFSLGAGVLKGFALTTIVGVTIGVFVTRPAYAKMLEVLMEKDE
jgi:preprotein translocase subunit SecD